VPNIAVLGAQWGDEGKGKIVDLLTPNFSIVARYQGGHNAGHTVYANGRKFVLRLLPSGILHPGITCVIGNGVVVDPSHLLGEIERVCDHLLAIDAGRLHYSGAVSEFTKQTQRLVVELDDDVPEFADRLRAAGLQVEGHGFELHLVLDGDAMYDTVRDVAADLAAPIGRMEVTRHRLQELFVGTGARNG
jgi:hypothetical protein